MEAIISLFFLISICSSMLLSLDEQRHLDDSLYRVQLADDAWRVLYLRGDFEGFMSSDADRAHLEEELGLLGDETGLCFFIDGVQYTNCRGGATSHGLIVAISKTVYIDRKPKTVLVSMGHP